MITTQNKDVWVAAGNGLHWYRDGSWITHTKYEGLPSTITYTVFEDSQGRLWAGTARGISLYHPNADSDPPETIIDPNKNLSEISSRGEDRLVYEGIDKWKFTQKERLLFSYRLDNEEWSVFQNEADTSLRELRPGSHLFEVRAMDLNRNIDPTPASFQFVVLLPWFKEPVFLLLSSHQLFDDSFFNRTRYFPSYAFEKTHG